jgi:hypothetical protein
LLYILSIKLVGFQGVRLTRDFATTIDAGTKTRANARPARQAPSRHAHRSRAPHQRRVHVDIKLPDTTHHPNSVRRPPAVDGGHGSGEHCRGSKWIGM